MLKFFGPAAVLTVVAVVVALVFGGPQTAAIVLLLGVLEISLSFDNAVVNAKVLNRMHPIWQRLFLTVGIIIAVFGMRLVLPIIIVALTASLSIPDVISLALNDADAYGRELASSEALIYAFGGTFLFMIFLDYMFDDERDVLWIKPVEKVLQKAAAFANLSVLVALGGIFFMFSIADAGEKEDVLIAGMLGLIVYLAVNGLDGLFEASMEAREEAEEELVPGAVGSAGAAAAGAAAGPADGKVSGMTGAIFKGGIFAFLYLEVLDASFSFDGVIGAFAISNEILVIALGLGIGAFWIRSLTVYLVRAGTLSEYIYLEHGAHWAIGVLASIMLLSVHFHIPEVVTGLTGVAFIAAALISSLRARRVQVDVDDTEDVLGSQPR